MTGGSAYIVPDDDLPPGSARRFLYRWNLWGEAVDCRTGEVFEPPLRGESGQRVGLLWPFVWPEVSEHGSPPGYRVSDRVKVIGGVEVATEGFPKEGPFSPASLVAKAKARAERQAAWPHGPDCSSYCGGAGCLLAAGGPE